MSVGAAGTTTPGMVEINVSQSAADSANVPQVVLDDPTNGAQVMHLGGESGLQAAATAVAVVIAGAGTAGTAALDATASDLCGKVTVVTGSAAWGTGAQANVTFGTPHVSVTYPKLFPLDATTASLWTTLKPYATPIALTGFAVNFQVADSSAHTLNIGYAVYGN